jgi:hypothetical protein
MRKWIGFFFLVAALAWAQSLPICADIYIWTDENGVKHFANEPPSGGTEAKQEAEHKTETGLQEKLEKDRSRLQDEMTGKVPVGADERVTRNPGSVVMYSRSNESHSRCLRSLFEKYKIAYTDYQIDKDEAAKRRFDMLGGRSAPLVFIGTRRFYGCNYGLVCSLFGIKD